MRKVSREEVLDLQRYEEQRDEIRRRVLPVKARRRIHLGDSLTFLFENAETIRYQVQEMIRAERMHREADVRREIDTYNGLLGDDGALGATLLIEIDDPGRRREVLAAWRSLPEHLYAVLPDGRRVRPSFDEGQRDADRLSAVQFLKFPVRGEVPVALGTDLPGIAEEVRLTPDQRSALAEDLADA